LSGSAPEENLRHAHVEAAKGGIIVLGSNKRSFRFPSSSSPNPGYERLSDEEIVVLLGLARHARDAFLIQLPAETGMRTRPA
jgi:hypothetical protein